MGTRSRSRVDHVSDVRDLLTEGGRNVSVDPSLVIEGWTHPGCNSKTYPGSFNTSITSTIEVLQVETFPRLSTVSWTVLYILVCFKE